MNTATAKKVSHKLVLHFPPNVVEQPVVYHLAMDYNLEFNILRASINPEEEGLMVIELTGDEADYKRATRYLAKQGIRIQALLQDISKNDDRCVDCGACVGVCPTPALVINRPEMKVVFDAEECVACGECVPCCPVGAMEIHFYDYTPVPYEERTYRHWVKSDLYSFRVQVVDSDLLISAKTDLSEAAERALTGVRSTLISYIKEDPVFATTLQPHAVPDHAPAVIREMAAATRACAVGPMAAVAGAVAEHVGRELLRESSQIIVENGGDIFMHTSHPRVAAIYAGHSPLSGKLGVKIDMPGRPVGLCTSSGTVGPSLSYGRADAAVVLSASTILADAAATALGNHIKSPADIEPALEKFLQIEGLLGALVILGEHLGAAGDIELTKIS